MQPLQADDPDRVGSYRLLARLGAGGMGVVYLGRSRSGRMVAVKVARKAFTADPRFRARFRREVEAARTVTGVFIAPVLEADAEATRPWLVTAYLPGLSLAEAVGTFGGLPPEAVRALAAGLAEALAAIHDAGVVHRDLKPDNIMLTAGGPRVIDFGIARPEDSTAITRAGVPIGTPGFMSPEQARGEEIGPPGDIFALGATLAYAASGIEPFGTGSMRSRLYRVVRAQAELGAITDPWLHELVTDCLRLEPAHRPSAADVLGRVTGEPSLQGTRWLPPRIAEEIDRRTADTGLPTGRVLAPEEPSGRMDAPTVPPPDTDPSRRTLIAGACAGAGALILGGAGVLLWQGNPKPRPGPRTARTAPPPRAALRWKRRIDGDYLDLSATGDQVMALTHDAVRALDPHTGEVAWKRGNAFSATPAGDVTYLALDGAKQVSAVRDGKTLWTYVAYYYEMPGEGMAIDGPVVCFGANRVSALNITDGHRRWTRKVSARYGLSAAGGLLVAVSSTALTGLDSETGRTRWTYPIDYGDYQVIGDGMVFACDRFSTLHAVRADTGTAVWRRPNVRGWGSHVGGGLLYAEGQDGAVLALRTTTGEVAWSRRLARFKEDSQGQATASGLYGGTLYVACTNGALYALDAAGGGIQWTYDEVAPMRIRPVSVAGQVVIGTTDGYVRALTPPVQGGGRSGGP